MLQKLLKTTEAAGKFIGNKMADKSVKLKRMSNVNLENIEEIIFPQSKEKQCLANYSNYEDGTLENI